jgi:hypothetical protein
MSSQSVGIVVFCGASPSNLKTTIRSVLAQTNGFDEVLFAWRSTSPTPAFLQQLTRDDNRFSVVRADEISCPNAWMTAVLKMTTDLVAFVYSGDTWAPQKLTLQLQTLADSSARWGVSGAFEFEARGGAPPALRRPDGSSLAEGTWKEYSRILQSTLIAPRSFLEHVGAHHSPVDQEQMFHYSNTLQFLYGPPSFTDEPLAGLRAKSPGRPERSIRYRLPDRWRWSVDLWMTQLMKLEDQDVPT